jgi:two-component system, OmpR family, sensor histidine kinase KdpD
MYYNSIWRSMANYNKKSSDRVNDENRPDPDSLLDLVNHDRSLGTRGRLKLFFGASAGVGKTYAMLAEARRKLKGGLDVVVGVVETHGREETAALLEGIPQIPRREVAHRGVQLYEFDLQAALERKPSLILMDELAHTNAPGSRHPKRWQDVEELLSHGIDVYTTLNVQHLESINDMVTKLTGVVVRETVPDSVFDTADDIALIDIPSDELLRRLNEGKVYIAEGANKRAAESFFKKPNLVALRELALRRTAERVDAEGDMLTAARGQREAQLGQKILVCVGHDVLSARVIRHAKRMAIRAKAPWYAVYVETGRHERLSEKAKLTADRNLRLAEKMGARILRITGSDAVEEILNYASSHGFTRIVVGHKARTLAARWLNGSLSAALIERGIGFEITTVTDEKIEDGRAYTYFWQHHFVRPSNYALAMGVVALATLLGFPFREMTDVDNLTMIYLTSIVIIAAWLGTGPSITASILSVAAFNFFFTQPYYTFEFYDKRYYFTFAVMLITSLIVGSLAAKLSLQARQSRKREAETSSLYALTRELSSIRGMDNMIEVALKHVRDVFGMDAVIFASKDGQLHATPAQSPARELKEESVARWVIANGQIAGRNTDTLPSARGLYVPMNAEAETLGVLGLIPTQEAYEFTSAQISQLETFASLIASAFGRAQRADDAERAKVESESEKLRNVLLSSVSHDLRTPLASISGISSSILLSGMKLPKHAKDGLRSIHDQSSKLAKIVTNLLDVSSLESGKVSLNRQPYFLEEVIGSALLRLEEILKNREVETKLGTEQLIHIDGLLVEQVFINLLENAAKYAGEHAKLQIHVTDQADFVQVTVSDNGCGIPKDDIPHIFEKFYKGPQGGLGLGLPICRAIIEVHGGRMWAENNQTGGASFHFTLPKSKNEAEGT